MAYDEEAHRQFLLRAATRAVEEWLDRYVKERPDKSELDLSRFDRVQCLHGESIRSEVLLLFIVSGSAVPDEALVNFPMRLRSARS